MVERMKSGGECFGQEHWTGCTIEASKMIALFFMLFATGVMQECKTVSIH